MENVTKYPICVMAFLKLSKLTLEQPVYFPGNDRHGIWSSPHLMTVVAPPATPPKPAVASASRPAAAAARAETGAGNTAARDPARSN
jgi:hypothetical protein